ncbi:hypothetical protein [Candidatus Accumulibacter sp. ACC003]|uniref:hypothetical protein n=1 Tax=Candidatus Accumulibacter sp. ACC003 TaxID=2823334 RepID=UPI0025C643D8|nr:hypothetical protein [Candidatus Accumulibacter sp. ACC003]
MGRVTLVDTCAPCRPIENGEPVVDGQDLVYSYELSEGKMPKAGGASALFIDWIAPGGEVEVGFLGVGIGWR